jgi:hypothetical protein
MQEISIKTIQELTLGSLGLDKVEYDATSVEAVAAQIRRAASFLCPCAPKTLVQAVVNVSKCVVEDPEHFRQKTKDVLEKMVAYGDLMEGGDWRSEGGERIAVLYGVPPGFVIRESGQFLLFGIGTSGKISLPIDLEKQVEQRGYVRWLKESGDGNLAELLLECGLTQVASDTWLRLPPGRNYQDYLMAFDQRLAKSSNPGDLGSLSVIDPNTPVNYYRGRWHAASGESGRFVCRRPRPYGADLWCYVELDNGQPTRLLDLPIDATLNRGCDEAWRLQAAIDARSHNPQKVLAINRPDGLAQLCFHSPVPMWVQRRLDVLGKPVDASEGCLFSYVVDKAEVDHELDCLRRLMWMKVELV